MKILLNRKKNSTKRKRLRIKKTIMNIFVLILIYRRSSYKKVSAHLKFKLKK